MEHTIWTTETSGTRPPSQTAVWTVLIRIWRFYNMLVSDLLTLKLFVAKLQYSSIQHNKCYTDIETGKKCKGRVNKEYRYQE